jgi:hypothetical protein
MSIANNFFIYPLFLKKAYVYIFLLILFFSEYVKVLKKMFRRKNVGGNVLAFSLLAKYFIQ